MPPAALSRLVAAALAAAALGPAGAAAQVPADPPPPSIGGLLDDLLRPGGRMDGLADEARRALEALRDSASPWTDALGAVIADPDAFHPPATLPNGDILIRRRDPPPPRGRADPPPAPPIDL